MTKTSIKTIESIFTIVRFLAHLVSSSRFIRDCLIMVRYLALLCLITFIYTVGEDNSYLMELFWKLIEMVCKMLCIEPSRVKLYGICPLTIWIHRGKGNLLGKVLECIIVISYLAYKYRYPEEPSTSHNKIVIFEHLYLSPSLSYYRTNVMGF